MSPNYDMWHSHYFANLNYADEYDTIVLKGTDKVPEKGIRFSDSLSSSWDETDAWVAPYEFDKSIERLWNNFYKYLDGLLAHQGIVSPDFSRYRNMPYDLQRWNNFRGRVIGALYESFGGECIPNMRPTDSRCFAYEFHGLPTGATVAMGTAGNLRHSDDRLVFERYVAEMVRRLHPKNILVYGKAPEVIFHTALDAGTNVVSFPTQTQMAHPHDKEVR